MIETISEEGFEVGDICAFKLASWGSLDSIGVFKRQVGIITKIKNKDKRRSNLVKYDVDVYLIDGKEISNKHWNKSAMPMTFDQNDFLQISPTEIAKIRMLLKK